MPHFPFQATESEAGDMDLSGLPETAVDSEDDDDEEDIERASDPLMSRDIVRDCLEKDPIDRTDDDIGKRPWRRMLGFFVLFCFKWVHNEMVPKQAVCFLRTEFQRPLKSSPRTDSDDAT